MKRRLLIGSSLLLAGCSVSPRSPEWVQWVPEAPPPEKGEINGPPDEPGQGWISGRWVRGDSGWEWQPGRFAAPPGPDSVWVPGTWVEKDGKWAWVPGSWR